MPLDDETYNAILNRVAGGELVTTVAKEFGVDRSDVWRYERQHSDTTGACLATYTQARVSQAHSIAEDTILIADGLDEVAIRRCADAVATLALVAPEDRQKLLNALMATAVARDRLRVDARRFLLAKIAPRIYGDTTKHVELTGANGGPVEVADVTQLQGALTARLAGIASRRKLLTATARVIEEPAEAEVVDASESDIVA